MTDKTTPLLEVKHLKQYFPINRSFSVKAVDDISFYINRGETYGYKTSGIDYTIGTEYHLTDTHMVLATGEEFKRWSGGRRPIDF